MWNPYQLLGAFWVLGFIVSFSTGHAAKYIIASAAALAVILFAWFGFWVWHIYHEQ